MARHLAFIDRLLADKDKLSAKCVQLAKDVEVASHVNHFPATLAHRQGNLILLFCCSFRVVSSVSLVSKNVFVVSVIGRH